VVEFQRAAKLNPLPEYQWALEDALNVKSQIVVRSGAEDPRTLSLYLATRHEDVDRAVKLAQQELTNRADIFTHDALAWALAAAGRVTEAQQHIDQALSEGTSDARLYFHAGVISALNNDNKQAKRWLDKAAAMKQTLFPSERELLDQWRQKI
jgi:Flp pilus assembly protein TadD